MVRGEGVKIRGYDTEPHTGMEELNHAPSHGRRKPRKPTKETWEDTRRQLGHTFWYDLNSDVKQLEGA